MNPMLILASHSILDASKGFDVGQFIQSILAIICLAIDSVIYYITSVAFRLYLAISQFEIFSTDAFNDLINRTYVVIGVISLFLVAYSLINAIISPDNASKGDKSVTKIVKNIIIAVIGIAIVPTVFNWFYYFQGVILCNNTIPKLLLKTVDDNGNTVEDTAKEFSALLFESFFYPNASSSVNGEAENTADAAKNLRVKGGDPYNNAYRTLEDGQSDDEYSLYNAYENAENGASFFKTFWPFVFGDWGTNGIIDNSVQYLVILSTIAGGYIAYVMISLCIDMGLRAIKLGYLELIAPLAIMTNVIPGKNSVFKTWSKKSVSCAIEVFTRLFVVVFAVYLINTIKDMNLLSFKTSICGIELGWISVLLLRALIICSIFAFVKQAPKFFSEATGIKSDGFKIGIMDKLKENGMAQALGATGAFATTGIRNVAAGAKTGGFAGALLGGVKSIPTAFKAGQKGWKQTGDIKKWSDVKNGINTASAEVEEEHRRWEDYKKSHNGTTKDAIAGKISDKADEFKDYWTQSHQANYNYENQKHQAIDKIVKADSAINDKAKALMDKYSSKVEYGGKSLAVIRKEEESINATLDGLAQERAKIVARGGDTSTIDQAINDYQNKSIKAHKDTFDAEKSIKSQIRAGKYDNDFNATERGELGNLYVAYHTVLKDNVSSLASDRNLYDYTNRILERTTNPSEFRQVIDPSNQVDPDPLYNSNKTPANNLSDHIKEEDTKVVRKINQEGEAVRKQQDKK